MTNPRHELNKAIHGPDWQPPAEDEPSLNGHSPFRRDPLGERIRKPRNRPIVADNILYPSKMHSLGGEPEAGKTVLVCWLLLRAMRLGHTVALFDEETGEDGIADLFQALGADPDMVAAKLHYFPYPEINWVSPDGRKQLHKLIADVAPVLAAFDSTATMLEACGLDENKRSDVTKLWRRTLAPIGRQHGCAVLVTDHDAKDGFDSKYGSGSAGKLAAVDVGIKLACTQQFNRDNDGALELRVTKDRPGCLHRNWRIAVTRNPLDLDWKRITRHGRQTGGEHPPGRLALLSVLTDTPADGKELVDRIMARPGGIPMRRETVSRYMGELEDEGLAESVRDPGQPTQWCLPADDPAPADAGPSTGPQPLGWN